MTKPAKLSIAVSADRKRYAGRGRRPQEGERYESGDLKPAGPNLRTIDIRKALMVGDDGRNWTLAGANTIVATDAEGRQERVDISKAENALDLMLSRHWMPEGLHRAARRYAAVFKRVVVSMPGMAVSRQEEARERSGVNKSDLAEMNDREKTAVFDAAFSVDRLATGVDDESRKEDGDLLRAIWTLLEPAEARQMFVDCVLESWPQWVVWMAAGKPVPECWDRKRRDLFNGLAIAQAVFKAHDKKTGDEDPDPPPPAVTVKPRGPKREERFEYVDPTGALIMEVIKVSRRPMA